MAKFVQGCKNILNILIFSNLILMVYQKGNLQKNILTRNLEASTSIITDLTTDFSSDLSDIFSTDLFSTTNSTEVTNSTFRYRQAKKSGLSAGGIIGIVAPCVVALGGLGAFVVLSKSNSLKLVLFITKYKIEAPAVNSGISSSSSSCSFSKPVSTLSSLVITSTSFESLSTISLKFKLCTVG